MQSLKKKLTGIILIAAAIAIPAQSAMAQWNLGLSYQIREESPKNGFGVRIEREILQKLPLVDLRLRGHFAYFNEENKVTTSGITFGEKTTYYDYGLSGIAGVSLGFLKPYVGIGVGASTIDIDLEEIKQDASNKQGSNTSFYWTGLVGVELTPLPRINPFIEYRLAPVDEAGDVFNDLGEEAWNSNGRLIIGVSISF